MGRVADLRFVSPDAYLKWENRQQEKHEYLRGAVYAMTGASQAHVVVNLNLAVALAQHLKGTGCRVYLPDMKLRIAAVDAFFYPDLKVSCDERDLRAEYAVEHPVLLVEILSDSTADYDRGTKLTAYLKLPSLKEYVLVDPDTRGAEVYRRNPDDTWLLTDCTTRGQLRLESIDLTLPLGALFEGL
jgi:Uma2 family endonuclease